MTQQYVTKEEYEKMKAYNNHLAEKIDQSSAYAEYVANEVNRLIDLGPNPRRKVLLKNPTTSIWSRLKLEARISIIIGICGLILSFLTLITR